MSTTYIGGLNHLDADESESKAEIQIDFTDGSGRSTIDLAVHDLDSGDRLGATELNRAKATELRDALTGWIDKLPA